MAITGLRNTDPAKLATGEIPQNYRLGILMNEPNGSVPLVALSSMMKSETTDAPNMHWYEKEHASRRLQLDADVANVDTDVTVVDDAFGGASQLKNGDILFLEETGELVLVTSIVGNITANVTRQFAGTSQSPITVATENPYAIIVGSAYEEGSLTPDERSYIPIRRSNNTQIFRDAIGVTRTARRTTHRTGEVFAELKRQALLYHTEGIERAFFLGKISESMAGTHPIRTCDGVFHVLTQWETDNPGLPTRIKQVAAGVLTLGALEEYMYEMFKYGSDQKVGFLGNRAILSINQAIRKDSGTQYTIAVGESEYGMKVMKLTSPFGELVLKRHPLFNEMTGQSVGNWYGMDSTMVVLDMASLRYRPLKGDDTRYIPDVQTPGLDGDKSEWLTECSLEINFANRHMWIEHLASA